MLRFYAILYREVPKFDSSKLSFIFIVGSFDGIRLSGHLLFIQAVDKFFYFALRLVKSCVFIFLAFFMETL